MDAWHVFEFVQAELFLFCAVFFCLGAIDDLGFDLTYAVQRLRGRIGRALPASTLDHTRTLPGPFAIFVPAWQEAAVIEATLKRIGHCIDDSVTVFVGCYPGDEATEAAVRRAMVQDNAIRLALNDRPGPTTKGDCLNAIWREMLSEENKRGTRFEAVVLHDAEDIMHSDEIVAHRAMLVDHPLSQLPVMPVVPRSSPWLAGHYAEEFAEAHLKELRVRQSIGAALPSAGVGCAIRRDYLDRRAREAVGGPFPAESLVEDYELGLLLGGEDGCGVLTLVTGRDGSLVATRALFPTTLPAVVRQKSRWVAGIALAGWDRLGWRAEPGEIWMRLHDRRSILAALVTALSYAVFLLTVALSLAGFATGRAMAFPPPGWQPLLIVCLINLFYRMAVRAGFTWRMHGLRQAMMSIPRTFVANIVSIMASWRAVLLYARYCVGGSLKWDKTAHGQAMDAAQA